MDKIKMAYQMLSQLSVSGDAVDIMAAARALLRDAMKEAEHGGQADKQPTGSDKR